MFLSCSHSKSYLSNTFLMYIGFFMDPADPRTVLERLIRERREDYSALSRLLGRNPAYVQQFIKRGTPKRLAETDRRLLARYFDIDEQLLGGPEPAVPSGSSQNLVAVARFKVAAAAGHGSIPGNEASASDIGFSPAWLQKVSGANPRDLSIIQVEGDSMIPTLSDGDEIMVDLSAARRRLRDGIHVLRRDDALLVKRVTLHPARSTITISSDNPAYASWTDCGLDDVEIIGRVVWASRRIN
jgi:phage repressor protein C with HTH and peptisase S24 domain